MAEKQNIGNIIERPADEEKQSYLNLSRIKSTEPTYSYSAAGAGPFDSSYKIQSFSDKIVFTFDKKWCLGRGCEKKDPYAMLGEQFEIKK